MTTVILPFEASKTHHIFQHYIIKAAIFGKRLLNIKFVLRLFTNVSQTFPILRINQGDIIIYIRLHNEHPLFCQSYIEASFSQKISEKCSYITFHENLSNGNQVPSCD
jgi:hypothetical protein